MILNALSKSSLTESPRRLHRLVRYNTCRVWVYLSNTTSVLDVSTAALILREESTSRVAQCAYEKKLGRRSLLVYGISDPLPLASFLLKLHNNWGTGINQRPDKSMTRPHCMELLLKLLITSIKALVHLPYPVERVIDVQFVCCEAKGDCRVINQINMPAVTV